MLLQLLANDALGEAGEKIHNRRGLRRRIINEVGDQSAHRLEDRHKRNPKISAADVDSDRQHQFGSCFLDVNADTDAKHLSHCA